MTFGGQRAAGALPFSVVGVLASLATPLAESGISVFAISTLDTDYLLVKEQSSEKAAAEWLIRYIPTDREQGG